MTLLYASKQANGYLFLDQSKSSVIQAVDASNPLGLNVPLYTLAEVLVDMGMIQAHFVISLHSARNSLLLHPLGVAENLVGCPANDASCSW